MPADQHHADERDQEWHRRHKAQAPAAESRRVAQDARQPQKNAIGDERVEEVDQADEQHASVQERLEMRPLMVGRALCMLARHRAAQPRAFCWRQPRGLLRSIGQKPQRDATKHDRGETLNEKQPLPSRQPHPSVERQQRLGDRRANQHGDGCRRHEERAGLGTLGRRNPVGQIQHHAGEEPGLGDAQQDAHRVEAPLSDDEHHRHRDEAPHDHDPGDPDASADSLQDQIARYLEQAVAEKEETAAQPVGGVAQAQIALQFRPANPMLTRSM